MGRTVTSPDEAFKELLKVESVLAKKILRRAMRAAAKPMQKAAKQNAPRKSGALQRSIKVRAGKRSRKQIAINVITGDRDQLRIPAGRKGYYPASQEYGWKTRGGRKVPGKQYMLRAFNEHVKQAETIASRQIRLELEREFRR